MRLNKIFERIASEYEIDPDHFEASLDHFISKKLLKSETLQKAFNVTETEMDELYDEAYTHYMKDEFKEASPLFRFLALFNPFEMKYWMGHAACLQLLEQYDKALQGYAVAAILDTKDPYPHYHAFECYMAKHDETEALKALDDARIRAAKLPIYSQLRGEIDELTRGKKYA